MAEKDHSLIKKTLDGDSAAFAELIERYAGLVHGLVLERIRRPDEVEDLVQEVFAKAYTHLATLRQPSRFGPWIARIAANLSTNWLQRHHTRLETESQRQNHPFSVYVQQPDEQLEKRQAVGLVWEALDRLAPEYRRVVVLFYLEGCTQRDIARFMSISVHTVRWRLYRAQRHLQMELSATLGREIGYGGSQQRQLKEKLLAALPVMSLFRLAPPQDFFANSARRGLAFLLAAGLLGLSGLLLYQKIQNQQESAQDQRRRGGFAVRYQPMDLPAASILPTPARPRAGEGVRLQWAAADLPAEGPVYLHYITDLDQPLDQVVQMRQDQGSWAATVQIPAQAANLFFYATPQAQPQDFGRDFEPTKWKQQMQRYTGALAVHDTFERPVRNAEFGLGRWAAWLQRPAAVSLWHYNRELARYPDHGKANAYRWSSLQESAENLDAVYAQIQAEKAALKDRFPDDPALAWTIIGPSGDQASLRAFESRFPKDKNAPAAAYRLTLQLRRDPQKRIHALTQFLRTYPRSAYTDDGYRDLLALYHHHDRGRGKALADSLISHQLLPYFDLGKEGSMPQWTSSTPYEGALPEARAYTLRFKWYMEEGDTTAALQLARRLVGSGLRDPIPYVLIGRQLVNSAEARDLGIEVLEAGLPWTAVEHMLTLPWFAFPSNNPRAAPMRRRDVLEWRIPCLQELGKVYLERGDCSLAAPMLRQSTQYQREYRHNDPPFDERAFLLLGQALVCVGKWEDAIDAYMGLVRRYYHHPEAEAALEALHSHHYGDLTRWQAQQASAWTLAPDFAAVDAAGDSLHLSHQRGQPVLLFCDWRHPNQRWKSDWSHLATWHDQYQKRGAKVLFLTQKSIYYSGDGGVPSRHEDILVDLLRTGDYPFPILFTDRETAQNYPTTTGGLVLFLVDRAGRLRLRQDRNHFFDPQEYNQLLEHKLEDLLREKPDNIQGKNLVARPGGTRVEGAVK